MGPTHLGSKNPRKFQKSRDFLGALSGGYTFHGSFSKRTLQSFVNQYFSLWEKCWLTKEWIGGFMTPFRSTSKADCCVLKIPCVLKIYSKPRPQKDSPAIGIRFSRWKILMIFSLIFLTSNKISYYKVRVSGGVETRWLGWQSLNGL